MSNLKISSKLAGFALLFLLYHAAEYMIVFRNSATGFLACHGLFIAAAYFIGKWQFGQGLAAWGLAFTPKTLRQTGVGLSIGIALYGITYCLALYAGLEQLRTVPPSAQIVEMLSLFVFGNFFSSFAEDVLTRAYVYRHLGAVLKAPVLVAVSAGIYVLNHIYRLHEGPGTYAYLFLLGVWFMLPLLKTKQLWLTGAMHWGGNCTFYLTHEIFETVQTPGSIPANTLLSGMLLCCIPLAYYLLKPGKPQINPV